MQRKIVFPQASMQTRHSNVCAHRTACALTTALFCLAFASGFSASKNAPTYSSKAFLHPIKYLSGDKLKGRGDGTPGLEAAARYIAHQFKRDGLQPAGDNGSY